MAMFDRRVTVLNILASVAVYSSVLTVPPAGHKAKEACRQYGESMLECQNVLHPESRVRMPVDLLLFPHMVLLGFGAANSSAEPRWKCGGSLISASWVLTAAHCLEDPIDGPVKVLRVGTATFEFDEIDGMMQERNVSLTVRHPLYKPPSKYHDIALIKAEPEFALNRDIRIACIQTERHFAYSNATAIGFGTTHSDSTTGSETLMRVDVDLVDSGTCNKTMMPMIRRGLLAGGILDSQLCAGDMEHGGRDTCQGDSGGPLQVFPSRIDCVTTFPLFYILGVTSFGRHCGFRRAPGVYTRVSHYAPWIESVVWT